MSECMSDQMSEYKMSEYIYICQIKIDEMTEYMSDKIHEIVDRMPYRMPERMLDARC